MRELRRKIDYEALAAEEALGVEVHVDPSLEPGSKLNRWHARQREENVRLAIRLAVAGKPPKLVLATPPSKNP